MTASTGRPDAKSRARELPSGAGYPNHVSVAWAVSVRGTTTGSPCAKRPGSPRGVDEEASWKRPTSPHVGVPTITVGVTLAVRRAALVSLDPAGVAHAKKSELAR